MIATGSCVNNKWTGGTAFLRRIREDPSEEVDLNSDFSDKEPSTFCSEGRAFQAKGCACAKALRWERD